MGNQEEAKLDRVSDKVSRLSNKFVALEGNVHGRLRAEDKEFEVLIVLLMLQMLKLDEIESKGEFIMRRKREVCCVQSIVESLDKLRGRNGEVNCSGTTQDLPLPGSRSLCVSLIQRLQQS